MPHDGDSTEKRDSPGLVIGNYRIVREIGRGGMGVVYEAEQQHPRRAVALKLIRGGSFVDEARVKLFQREAQTLARLKHPDIAAIYESGCTDDGEHFFAMELVRGATLDEYLRKAPATRPLSTEDIRGRLRLFVRLCQAVSYAHQRGVIHRDLKPANILVAPHETSGLDDHARPSVKILDFGLARITDTDRTMTTLESEVGSVKGTLPYMSPEQVRGETDEIDVRTDVYALGVILYEMLADRQPYALQMVALHQAARIICEQPPTPLSKVWVGPRRPDSDLGTIVGKALEKDPALRFQSAAALADDITRYLRGEPILARPPSTAYQLRKLVSRHKAVVALCGLLLVLLVASVVATTLQASRLAEERDRADVAAQTAQQVAAFLTELFLETDPSMARGNEVTAREILDRGAERVRHDLVEQPELQARLMTVIGEVYINLGLTEPAYDLVESAVRIRQELHPQGHLQVAESLLLRSKVLHARGDYELAERDAREALSIMRRDTGDDSVDVATGLNNLAVTLKVAGRIEEAESAYRSALAIRRQAYGRDHDLTIGTLTSLAELQRVKGDLNQAESLSREALDAAKKLHGDVHPQVATCANNLALVLQAKGDQPATERLLREVMELQRRLYGEPDGRIARSMNNLAALLREMGRLEEAEAFHRKALEMRRSTLGRWHPEVASSLNNLAVVLRDRGQHDEAVTLMQEAIDIVRSTKGDDHLHVGISLYNLADFLRQKEDWKGVAETLHQGLPIMRQNLGTEHWRVAMMESMLGQSLAHLGDPQEAERLLLRSYEIVRAELGDAARDTERTRNRLVRFYEETGDEAQAARYRDSGKSKD